jgi:hypothetical protein
VALIKKPICDIDERAISIESTFMPLCRTRHCSKLLLQDTDIQAVTVTHLPLPPALRLPDGFASFASLRIAASCCCLLLLGGSSRPRLGPAGEALLAAFAFAFACRLCCPALPIGRGRTASLPPLPESNCGSYRQQWLCVTGSSGCVLAHHPSAATPH